MKKVLILAYDFPPYVSVGGLRPYSWYKYLKDFGVFPIIITRQWNNKFGNSLDYIAPGDSKDLIFENSERGLIIRTPYNPNLSNRILLKYGSKKFKFFRKIITGLYELFQWILFVGPKSQLYFGARKFLSENRVDLIIATGEPFILFKYASILSLKYNIPWIADYRDPWLQDSKVKKNALLKLLTRFIEKKYLKKVQQITTVSEYFKYQISNNLRKKRIDIVPNGYDEEAIEHTLGIKQGGDKLNISFVGTIYKYYPIKQFIKTIAKFIEKERAVNLKINFYGINREKEIENLINNEYKEIKEFVSIMPKLSNDALLNELAGHNILLLFNDYSIIRTKIYDYLGLNRLILLCFRNDKVANKLKKRNFVVKEHCYKDFRIQEKIIKETNAGIIIEDADQLYKILGRLYNEFLLNGRIECNAIKIEDYSRKSHAKKLADIIFKNEQLQNRIKSEVPKNKKKCLILAYDFPPYVSVGALRPVSWYKNFYKYNIYPIVITRQWNNVFGNKFDYVVQSDFPERCVEMEDRGCIVKTPYYPNISNRMLLRYGENKYKFFRKIVTAYFEGLQWISMKGPKNQIYKTASEFIKNNNVDFIIATGEPFVLFKYASKLSKRYQIPWIADYRDAWTQNHYNSKNVIIKNWNAYLEKKYLKNSQFITTVSKFIKIKITQIINKRVYLIANGYDPESIIFSEKIEQDSETMSIAYIGTVYKWHPIESFLKTISEWLGGSTERRIVVNFYGINIQESLVKLVNEKFPVLKKVIRYHNKLQNKDLFSELAKNNLLLLFNDYSIMGTKIYDYLAAKRRILLCYSDDEFSSKLKKKYFNITETDEVSKHLQQDLINETNAGCVIRNEDELKKILEELYHEFKKQGTIHCFSKSIEQYSREFQTQEFVKIISKEIWDKKLQ